MQHRSNQSEAPVGRAAGKPAAGVPLPAEWTRLLAAAGGEAAAGPTPTLGFLLELLQDEPAVSRIEIAPVLLETVAKGRLGRAVPLDPKQLLIAALAETETRLAASVLGLPQTQRKGRTYAQLSSAFGDALLCEILRDAPSLLGGVAGIVLQHLALVVIARIRACVEVERFDLGVEFPRLDEDETEFAEADFELRRCYRGHRHGHGPSAEDWRRS